MAKSQQTYSKSEKEKKRLKKREEKQKKKEGLNLPSFLTKNFQNF